VDKECEVGRWKGKVGGVGTHIYGERESVEVWRYLGRCDKDKSRKVGQGFIMIQVGKMHGIRADKVIGCVVGLDMMRKETER
jgi:hypothetical protein